MNAKMIYSGHGFEVWGFDYGNTAPSFSIVCPDGRVVDLPAFGSPLVSRCRHYAGARMMTVLCDLRREYAKVAQ